MGKRGAWLAIVLVALFAGGIVGTVEYRDHQARETKRVDREESKRIAELQDKAYPSITESRELNELLQRRARRDADAASR